MSALAGEPTCPSHQLLRICALKPTADCPSVPARARPCQVAKRTAVPVESRFAAGPRLSSAGCSCRPAGFARSSSFLAPPAGQSLRMSTSAAGEPGSTSKRSDQNSVYGIVTAVPVAAVHEREQYDEGDRLPWGQPFSRSPWGTKAAGDADGARRETPILGLAIVGLILGDLQVFKKRSETRPDVVPPNCSA